MTDPHGVDPGDPSAGDSSAGDSSVSGSVGASPARHGLPVEQHAWQQFHSRLWAFARRRTASDADADDVVQWTLMRLQEQGGALAPGRVVGWLFTTARHAAVDLARARARASGVRAATGGTVPGGAPAGEPAAQEVPDPTAAQELSTCIRPLLALLDEADRRVLEAVEFGGRAQSELAQDEGVPLSTVKSRVQRARRRLRALFERCCVFDLDARGLPVDYTLRGTGSDVCGGTGPCGQ